MSTTATTPRRRHALGLPAGSIRALLALGVLGYLWALFSMLLRGDDALRQQAEMPFIYFNIIMVLIIAHFFAAHGSTIGHQVSAASPLGLPAGSIRLILLGGYLGLAYYLVATQPKFDIKATGPIVVLVTVMLSCFVIGFLSTRVVSTVSSGGVLPAWFQDVQAWIALLGILALGILILMRLVINPSVAPENQLNLDPIEIALSGLVGFYFGARS